MHAQMNACKILYSWLPENVYIVNSYQHIMLIQYDAIYLCFAAGADLGGGGFEGWSPPFPILT